MVDLQWRLYVILIADNVKRGCKYDYYVTIRDDTAAINYDEIVEKQFFSVILMYNYFFLQDLRD